MIRQAGISLSDSVFPQELFHQINIASLQLVQLFHPNHLDIHSLR